MIGLLPILTVLIMLFFIITIIAKVMKITVNRKGKYSYSKRTYWVMGGYIGSLLIFTILGTFLPTNDMKVAYTSDLEKEYTNLYNLIMQGKTDKIDRKFVDKKLTFQYDDHELEVVANDGYNLQIIVEKKENDDDKIEAVLYKTRSNINNMDISSLANSSDIELVGNKLVEIKPKKVKIEISQFKNPFTVRQFTSEKLFDSNGTILHQGQSILYLRIPRDLKLDIKTNSDVQFVKHGN